jgi:Flp pilus assembly protein TadG
MKTVFQHPMRSARLSTSGQALVEFALVVPIFFVMLFGLIDGGRYVYMSSVLSQAAREGARLAAVEASHIGVLAATDPSCNQLGGPVCPATAAALKTDVLNAANRMVTPFASITSANLYISCDPAAGPTPSGAWTSGTACTGTAGTTPGSGASGNLISVRVVLTFTPFTPGLSQIGTITTSGSATMVSN